MFVIVMLPPGTAGWKAPCCRPKTSLPRLDFLELLPMCRDHWSVSGRQRGGVDALQLLRELLACFVVVIPALLPQVRVAVAICAGRRAARRLGLLVWPICHAPRHVSFIVRYPIGASSRREKMGRPSTGKSSNSSSSSSGAGALLGSVEAAAGSPFASAEWS